MSPIDHHITGRQYWRSLEELAADPSAAPAGEGEHPHDGDGYVEVSRRRFLKLMSASLALAGLTLSGCRRWPKETIAPYASSPADRMPGEVEHYATVMELGGVAMPLLVTAFDGRPIKIEGNPSHPFSRVADTHGAADAFAQASVLELYDPDRSRQPIQRIIDKPRPATWDEFQAFAAQHFGALRQARGEKFAVLCEATSSPSVAAMKKRMLEACPQAKWYEYEPLSNDNELAGAKLAFNQPLRPVLHLDKAAVVVLFDADLLGSHPAHVRYAADWAARRRSADEGSMSRMYIAESGYSLTGAVADERLPLRPSRIEAILVAIAARLAVPASPPSLTPAETRFVDAVVRDLGANRGQAVVAAGPHLSPKAQALVHTINMAAGAAGKTLTFHKDESADRPSHLQAMADLAAQIKAGQVNTLLIFGGNPAYDAPADLEFAKALSTVPMSIHLSLYHNETSAACRWHLPRAHYLESWGDARAYNGTVSVAQPLIEPLFGGKSIIEVLAMALGDPIADGQAIVRRTITAMLGGDEKTYRRVLHDGLIANSAWPSEAAPTVGSVEAPALTERPGSLDSFELRFLPDSRVYDGRFANNGWLQELPDTLTKLTWDNAALISVQDARRLGLTTGDFVRITANQRSIEIPVYILPGQPVGVIGLPLGYGRTDAGNIGNGVGFNVNALRTAGAFFTASGVTLAKLGKRHDFAMTQDHHLIDAVGAAGRDQRVGAKGHSGTIIREGSLAEYRADRKFAHRHGHGIALPLYDPPHKFNDPHAWGMAVDMNSCIGCNACVVACQSENNVPIVGKDEVRKSREMHWIRIDRYFKGDAEDPSPQVVYQPMMCQHCETAPCEQVCPVGATMHDTEGLNAMAYNRCVGTRYCANNCPYKVRRFNYLDYHSKDPRSGPKPWLGMPDTQQQETIDKIKRMVFNPDVTVRMRGVMEKCTYCVQRIHATTIDRRNKNEPVRDGDVLTACQQACPTQAIVFGDLNDPNSRVSQLHRNSRAYDVLDEELRTRPRTRYLAKLRNPAESQPKSPDGHTT